MCITSSTKVNKACFVKKIRKHKEKRLMSEKKLLKRRYLTILLKLRTNCCVATIKDEDLSLWVVVKCFRILTNTKKVRKLITNNTLTTAWNVLRPEENKTYGLKPLVTFFNFWTNLKIRKLKKFRDWNHWLRFLTFGLFW